MSGCREWEVLLARHLHGELLRQDREALENHLAACPECRSVHRDVSSIDRMLRESPGKIVEPPAHLHARILANLPEDLPPLWGRWGRWAFGLGTAAVALVAVFLGIGRWNAPEPGRVASVPAPPAAAPSAKGSPHGPGAAGPARSGAAALRSAPGGGGKRGAAVASAPKVQVIKEVKIFFYYPPARKVAVTGDFNDWNAEGVPMQASGKPGLWEAELRLPPGVYSYNFIVDGELIVPDPNSPNQMPDGYGGTNSLLLVKEEGAI